MRWIILACTGGVYILLLLGLAALEVGAASERQVRTSVSRIDSQVYLKRGLLVSRYFEP